MVVSGRSILLVLLCVFLCLRSADANVVHANIKDVEPPHPVFGDSATVGLEFFNSDQSKSARCQYSQYGEFVGNIRLGPREKKTTSVLIEPSVSGVGREQLALDVRCTLIGDDGTTELGWESERLTKLIDILPPPVTLDSTLRQKKLSLDSCKNLAIIVIDVSNPGPVGLDCGILGRGSESISMGGVEAHHQTGTYSINVSAEKIRPDSKEARIYLDSMQTESLITQGANNFSFKINCSDMFGGETLNLLSVPLYYTLNPVTEELWSLENGLNVSKEALGESSNKVAIAEGSGADVTYAYRLLSDANSKLRSAGD
jgi:hypothetical protein